MFLLRKNFVSNTHKLSVYLILRILKFCQQNLSFYILRGIPSPRRPD
jgi:hypothetical protein